MGCSRYRVLGSHPHFLTCSVVEMTRAMNQLVLTVVRASIAVQEIRSAMYCGVTRATHGLQGDLS